MGWGVPGRAATRRDRGWSPPAVRRGLPGPYRRDPGPGGRWGRPSLAPPIFRPSLPIQDRPFRVPFRLTDQERLFKVA